MDHTHSNYIHANTTTKHARSSQITTLSMVILQKHHSKLSQNKYSIIPLSITLVPRIEILWLWKTSILSNLIWVNCNLFWNLVGYWCKYGFKWLTHYLTQSHTICSLAVLKESTVLVGVSSWWDEFSLLCWHGGARLELKFCLLSTIEPPSVLGSSGIVDWLNWGNFNLFTSLSMATAGDRNACSENQ